MDKARPMTATEIMAKREERIRQLGPIVSQMQTEFLGMNKEQNKAREKLERLCNTLADDIDAMSDEELLAELKEAGEDADAIASQTGALVADAIANFGRRKLAARRDPEERAIVEQIDDAIAAAEKENTG